MCKTKITGRNIQSVNEDGSANILFIGHLENNNLNCKDMEQNSWIVSLKMNTKPVNFLLGPIK